MAYTCIPVCLALFSVRQVALVCMSEAFAANSKMCDVFHFLHTNMQKSMQIVAIGKNLNWQNTNIGMLIASDVSEKYRTRSCRPDHGLGFAFLESVQKL